MGPRVPGNGTRPGFRVSENGTRSGVPKYCEPYLDFCFERFEVGFPVLGNPERVPFPGIHSDLPQNERKSMSNYSSGFRNAQKRIFNWVPGFLRTKPETDTPIYYHQRLKWFMKRHLEEFISIVKRNDDS